jgi:hypothetical protein
MVWLSNPGFETGNANEWTLTTSGGGGKEVQAAYAYNSNYGCWIYQTDSTVGKYASLDNLMELPSNATTLEFDFKRFVNDGNVKIELSVLYIVTWYVVYTSTGGNDSNWTHVSISKSTIESVTGALIQNLGAIMVTVTRV